MPVSTQTDLGIPCLNKRDCLIKWGGGGEHFLKKYHNVPIFDIGQHSPVEDKPWYKGYMSIKNQLAHKFIFCIEGWDTATSMKWVMSSNSLCVMPKPKYEFMGRRS